MPSLFRFLIVAGILSAVVFGGLYVVGWVLEPEQREMSTSVPGVKVRRTTGEGIARLVLPNGVVWSFLWEGAQFREEDSVRQSAYLGFHRTRQMVLETTVTADTEVAWIFTLEQQ